MKQLATLLFVFFICFHYSAQDKSFDKETLLKDFDVFQQIYQEANAGLYKFHSKKEIDKVFSANRKKISDKTSYRDFYNLIWNVVEYSGSCHSNLSFPDSITNILYQKKIFFPLPLKYLSGKVYVNAANQEIPLGSEIISINKIDAKAFCNNVSKYASTDGHNVTGKFAFLETNWLPFFIYLQYGEQKSFLVKSRKDGVILNTTLNAADYIAIISIYDNKFIPTYQETLEQEYSLKYLDKQTALLNVNTFALGGPTTDEHKKYANFLDSVFTDLKTNNTPNLIVDVRQNGGGNDPNDLLLYSYITKRNFRENLSAFTLFNTVPLQQYYFEEYSDEIKDLEEQLKEEHSELKDGKYYQNDTFNKVWQPNVNAFQGKTYLLIDPFVGSAGSLFASMVKSDENSVVVGQETLGGYYGHTGHIPVTYKLPNTKLMVTFSIVDLDQDVKKLRDQKQGDGIKPDFLVEPTITEYLNSIDVALEFVMQLINK